MNTKLMGVVMAEVTYYNLEQAKDNPREKAMGVLNGSKFIIAGDLTVYKGSPWCE